LYFFMYILHSEVAFIVFTRINLVNDWLEKAYDGREVLVDQC